MSKPYKPAKRSSLPWLSVALMLSAPAFAQTTITRADTDAHNLLYSISYTGTPAFRQIFLDTDQNTSTGYPANGVIGADYLIENGALYRYSGTGGAWAWTLVTNNVGFTTAAGSNSTTASWTVAQTAVGSPAKIDLIANTHDPASVSQKMTQVVKSTVSITQLQGDASYLYYQVTFTGSPSFHHLYLDTDQNPTTGYQFGGIGADYLIENGALYTYTGSGTDWNWTAVAGANVNYTSTGSTANWKVDSKDLAFPPEIDIIADVSFPAGSSSKVTQRNPHVRPFAETSIWNRPMGTGATFDPATLGSEYGGGANQGADMPQPDLNAIVMTPTVTAATPLTPIYPHTGSWGADANWCIATSNTPLDTVPMPTGYVVSYPDNTVKGNSVAALLRQDGRTISQSQPFARCTQGGYATSTASMSITTADLYSNANGADQYGPHGGSGMSAIGGSIRLGEMRPGMVGIRHALEIEVDTGWVLHQCNVKTDCWTWPARGADASATTYYGRRNPDAQLISSYMKMGALLAIPPSVDINALGLRTEPGRQLAWTLQNYGAYIVDGRSGPGININVDEGADGSKLKEFSDDFHIDFHQRWGNGNPWMQDVEQLISALEVVKNNAAGTQASGGGTPLQPLSPPLNPPQ